MCSDYDQMIKNSDKPIFDRLLLALRITGVREAEDLVQFVPKVTRKEIMVATFSS